MRTDLNKQLCEHERYSSHDHYTNYRNLKKFNPRAGAEGENLPVRESMKYRYGWDRKHFGENLAPLYGAIRKAVGRKWDKFYSELCETFDKRSVINQHIIQHLFRYVEVKTVYVGADDELYIHSNYSEDRPIKGSSVEYYVDPRDGILKRNKWYRSWKAGAREAQRKRELELAKVFRQLDDRHVLRLVDGVWFEYELKEIPEGKIFYDKPRDKDVFKSYIFSKEKSWDQLTGYEKQRFGVARHIGGRAVDIFTGDTVYRDGGVVRRSNYGRRDNHIYVYRDNLYHASRKTASHKTLKKAGIV